MFLWNRIWSLSLVPAKPTKWLLYDEFMKNLMLWEKRRVFTVSELSKVEQGGKIWFLFGSQGTWHTKCFYEGKKGRSGSEFSKISWFPFGCFTAVAFLGNSHFKEKFGAHSSHLPPFNRTCHGERRLGLPTASGAARTRKGLQLPGRLATCADDICEHFCHHLSSLPGLATLGTEGFGKNGFVLFLISTCAWFTDTYKEWLGQGGVSTLWKI